MSRRMAQYGMLCALMMIFGYVEAVFPVVLPIPGMKLGIANVVLLLSLYTVGVRGAAAVFSARVVLTALLFGNAFSFILSLCGGAVALGVMALLYRKGKTPLVWESACGGVMHNVGQIAAASVIFKNPDFFLYLPVLTVFGALCGIVTGKLTERLLNMMKIRR